MPNTQEQTFAVGDHVEYVGLGHTTPLRTGMTGVVTRASGPTGTHVRWDDGTPTPTEVYTLNLRKLQVERRIAREAKLSVGDKLAFKTENGTWAFFPIVSLYKTAPDGTWDGDMFYGVQLHSQGGLSRWVYFRSGDSVWFVRAHRPLTDADKLAEAIKALRELSGNTVAEDALRKMGEA